MEKDVKTGVKHIKETRKKAQKIAKKKGKKAIKFAGKTLKKSKPLPLFSIFESGRTNLLFLLLIGNGIFFLLSLVQIIWGSIAGKELNEALKVPQFQTAQRVNLATLMGVLAGFQMTLTLFSSWINYFVYKGVITVAVDQVQTVVDEIFEKGMKSDKYLKMKPVLDKMQFTHQCCGKNSPDEWFTVGWQEALQQDGNIFQTIENSVPASCCMRDAPSPCINKNVVEPGIITGYNWKNGNKVSVNQIGCSKIIGSYMNDRFIYPFKCYIGILLALSVIKFLLQRILETSITEACKYDLPFSADDPAYGYIFKGWGSTPPNLLEDASKVYAYELCKQAGVDPSMIFGEGETLAIVMSNLGCKTAKECSNFIKKCEEDFKERLNEESDENHKYKELLRLAQELESEAVQAQISGEESNVDDESIEQKDEEEIDHVEESDKDENDDEDDEESHDNSEEEKEDPESDNEQEDVKNGGVNIDKDLTEKKLTPKSKKKEQTIKTTTDKSKRQGQQKKLKKTTDEHRDKKADRETKKKKDLTKDEEVGKITEGKKANRSKKVQKEDKEGENQKIKKSPTSKGVKGESNVQKSQKDIKSKVKATQETTQKKPTNEARQDKKKQIPHKDQENRQKLKETKTTDAERQPKKKATADEKQGKSLNRAHKKQETTESKTKQEATPKRKKDREAKTDGKLIENPAQVNTKEKATKRAKSPRGQGRDEDDNERGKKRQIRFSSRKLSDFVGSPSVQFGDFTVHAEDEIVQRLRLIGSNH
ncbi:DgyrCDS5276 [Dimorphilus gyrociliatus]|uniref:DgyrCDS5276 n=1 Tax=Dimorphilus gyrociliatus TaxID=2664684 RepID=A0A7I8VP80_9ANNE|nr:DgyrCDS5276 [Dimorphilus gyrociliatus]